MKRYITLILMLIVEIATLQASQTRHYGPLDPKNFFDAEFDEYEPDKSSTYSDSPSIDKWGLPITRKTEGKVNFEFTAGLYDKTFCPKLWCDYQAYLSGCINENGDKERVAACAKHVRANINQLRDDAGMTPLHMLARWSGSSFWKKCISEMQDLISRGADINAQDALIGRTPLHEAAFAGNPEVVKFLLANEARVDLEDAQGRTALDHAREFLNPRESSDWAVINALLDAQEEALPKKQPDNLSPSMLSDTNSPYGPYEENLSSTPSPDRLDRHTWSPVVNQKIPFDGR